MAAVADELRIAKRVVGERDWFIIPWDEVFARTGLPPQALPGVRTTANHTVETLAPRTAHEFLGQAGSSARKPFPYRVHRSHLPALGYLPYAPIVDQLPLRGYDPILRPHQAQGGRFIRERRGVLLADEMRTGKSATVVYAHDPGAGAMVVIGPVAARAVWHEWAARRFGACQTALDGDTCSVCARVGAQPAPDGLPSFVALVGRTPDLTDLRRGARVAFLTYATVAPWSECFMSFGQIGTLVADEAHLAGVQNRRNITITGIRRLNTCADRVVFASGSPMWNMPAGLWPIVDTICPTAFGSYWEFARRYCDGRPGAHGWTAEGVTNERELELRLSAIMLRRTWNDIQADLPPINRAIEYVELTEAQHVTVFETANELRKAAGLGKPQTVVGNLERLRKLYARSKVARAVEIVRETLMNGHSVVVWAYHRDTAQALWEAMADLPIHGPIHGHVPPAKREELLDRVRGDNLRPRVLIATMGALATAVSLNWASHEVFVELDWTPAVIQQAEMRPFDGTRPISATYLVADCDPDRRQVGALLAKVEAQGGLGLRSGAGDVASVLGSVFGVDPGKTLDAVAEMILAAETL